MTIKAINEKVLNLEPLTAAEKSEFIRASITAHDADGKMADFMSISTSALCSVSCALRSKYAGSVCKHCCSRKMLKLRKTLREKMERNTVFYTKYEILPDCVPLFNACFFRFESFGELQNETQVKNYFTIARKNPHCVFAIWTKNINHIGDAIRHGEVKPDNLIVVYSSLYVNTPEKRPPLEGIADKIFTVWSDSETAKKAGHNINCPKQCRDCMKCYTKEDSTFFINEILK